MTDATRPTDDEVLTVTQADREAFEAWAMNAVPLASQSGHHGTGGTWVYRHNIMQLMWQCWRAASTTAPQPHIAAEPGEVEREALVNQAVLDVLDVFSDFLSYHKGGAKPTLEQKAAVADRLRAAVRSTLTAPEPRAAGEGTLEDERTIRELGFAIKDAVKEAWPMEKRDRVARAALKCIALRQPSTDRESTALQDREQKK